MADMDYNIKLILEAQNKANADIVSLQAELKKLESQATKTSQNIEKSADNTFNKIKNGLKTLGIATAIYKVGQSIRDLTTAMEPVESSFYRLSETAGVVADDMLQAMQKASLGTVSDYELMSQANKAYSLGVVSSIDEMTTLIEIARLKGQAMGRTMEEALGDIVTGLGRASPLILDNLGIVIKQSEAQEKYAQSIGKTVDELTEAEKKQALVNAVVEQGKIELENAGEVSLTTQERFAQLQSQFQNLAVEIGQNVMPRVNYFLEQLNTGVKENENVIIKAVSGVIKVIAGGLSTAYNVIATIGELLGGFFGGLRVSISNSFNKFLNRWINRINTVTSEINNIFGTNIGKLSEKMVLSGEDMAEVWTYSLGSAVTDVENRRDKFIDDYMKTNKEAQNVTKNTAKSIGDLMGDTPTGSGAGKSSSSKKNDELKKIQETYNSITKSIDEQEKVIKETNKERQKGYDELNDKFEEAEKNVQSLKDSVADLRKELSNLAKDETSDVASEFVSARKELQKMERDYAGIGEVASKYSLSELENYQHGGIGKYDIDALIQYKKYSDELESVYKGLNDNERKAMDEQIAYQEWYQSLNGIEKIKEDYRIKREEIQSELSEKLSALREEQIKRAEIDKQMKQYQKERLQAIDVEIKKWIAMYKEKMEYEKQYQAQLEIDYQKQMEMYNALIRKAKELAEVRASTGGPSGARASGGPVYAGQSYLVGENGPELFIPSQNGNITRNEDLSKGQEFTININMGGVVVNDGQDTDDLAETIANTITRQLELYKKGIY